MNLHDLLDTATADLPPLPDLAPSARRIVRRRQLATRSTAAVLTSALAIGAGTFALSATHDGSGTSVANGSTRSYSRQYAADVLQSLWPDKTATFNVLVRSGGQKYNTEFKVMHGSEQFGSANFAVWTDPGQSADLFSCQHSWWGGTCLAATTADGDRILADLSPDPGIDLNGAVENSPSPGSKTATANAKDIHAYRMHDGYISELTVMPLYNSQPTAKQILDLVDSTAYEQLIESAIAAHYFPTPADTNTTSR